MAEVREDGPYWVKLRSNLDWQIAYWYNESRIWRFANPIDAFVCVDIIGPRILPPEEKENIMAEDRETGLYWVMLISIDVDWRVAHWYDHTKLWRLLDEKDTYCDVTKIGPRILPPKKDKILHKKGYYWVKLNKNSGWEIAGCSGLGYFYFINTPDAFQGNFVHEIGPEITQTPPEEK